MKSFVDIKTFFSSDEVRTIDKLACVYEDETLLYDSVKQIILPHIPINEFKGKRVLIKPNFVRQNERPYDEICLFTNLNLLYATLKVILECGVHAITIGDAPIQDCDWNLMLDMNFYNRVETLSKEYNIPIKIVDFRKVIFNSKTNVFGRSMRLESDYIIFDLAKRSWLEPITSKENKFRVTNYNPDRMAMAHAIGKHEYCIAKEVFESDIVITMPKVKTHRMACITNSLKILVGINGDKDYLPHHRIGSKDQGGDCYKEFSYCRLIAESLLDFSNRHKGSMFYKPARLLERLLWKLSGPNGEISENAGWYGNDTVWRMVLDLNTIALYGKLDGTLSNTPQRTLFTLCDGIIGGEKNGPLRPDPLPLGVLAFSNDSYLMDVIAGKLFSLDIEKVPLLRQANDIIKDRDVNYILNGQVVSIEEILKLKTNVQLADGWVNYNIK